VTAALDLMLNQSNVAVFCNFLVKKYHQAMQRIFLPALPMIYGMALQKMMMKR